MIKFQLNDRWTTPPSLPDIYQKLRKGYSWDRIVEDRFNFGSPITFLINDLHCIHKFNFDEVWLLRDLLDITGIDSLKALYKLEIISRLRIWRLLYAFIKYNFHQYMNNQNKRGIQSIGVFWGSTGRFEASETSDYEFLFIRRDTDLTTTRLIQDFNSKLKEISVKLIEDLRKCPIFKGSHPCGTITDYGIKRSWNYMFKHKRPMLVAYLFSYCFFSDPKYLHKEMKKACLQHFGLKEIIDNMKKQMGIRKFKSIFQESPDTEINISIKTLKDYAIDTIQSLALLYLREETGHSLIDDALKMRDKGFLNNRQTLEIISSILEIYKSRVKRDTGEEIITTPRKLIGFKIAYELMNEAYDKI